MTISQEIIERVRKATGPDRELDWRIAEALNIPEPWPTTTLWPPFAAGSRFEKSIPDFTAFIDAAVALAERVLPGSMKRVFDNPDDGSVRAEIIHGLVYGKGDHATWPLAIILATLIATQSSETK